MNGSVDATVCKFVRRLGVNEYFYQLKYGNSLSFVSCDGTSEVYTKRALQQRNAYDNQSKVSINETLHFAGEMSDVFYFYSMEVDDANRQYSSSYRYRFYAVLHMTAEEIFMEEIREEKFHNMPHFALEQPFFVSADRRSIKSFTEESTIILNKEIRDNQMFFCRKNVVYIVEHGGETLSSKQTDNVISITLPMAMQLPQSFYFEESSLYMICGHILIVLDNKLGMSTTILNGFDTLNVKIGGIYEGTMLINAHDRFIPQYNMLLELNICKINNDAGTNKYSTKSNATSEKELTETSFNEKEIAQAMHQSVLEAEILKLQDTIKTLQMKNQHNQQIPPNYEDTMLKTTQMSNFAEIHGSRNNLVELVSSKFSHDYEIRNVLGCGAYGVVFKATNTFDNYEYAVKRIAVESKEKNVEKALNEVRTMAHLDHPCIVRYNSTWIEAPPKEWQHEVDCEIMRKFPSVTFPFPNSHHMSNIVYIYIQMQLCKYSLDEWLKQQDKRPRNIPRMIKWFKQIVSAVEYIHGKKLIHRDLKPSNILFVDDDQLKICDLGIATQMDGEETRTFNMGTPLYMSPEQSGCQYTFKVDVFTLGLILIDLCDAMINNERGQIFWNLRRGIPYAKLENQPQVAAFVAWLTQKDPARRPTCTEIMKHEFICQELNII